jgi:hypothetical protein
MIYVGFCSLAPALQCFATSPQEHFMHQTYKQTLLASAITLTLSQAIAQEAPTPTEVPQVAEVGGDEGAGGGTRNRSSVRTNLDTNQTTSSTLNLEWTGGRPLAAEATANSSTVQSTTSNTASNLERSPNRTIIESGAAEGANGNVGLNMAAGTGNLQGNSAAIASTQSKDVFANASTYANQTTTSNFTFNVDDSSNDAVLDAALSGASGNIGVNVASGAANTQSNQLSMIETGGSRVARSSVAVEQSSSSNQSENNSLYDSSNSANNARMVTGALSAASGNVGVSVSAGVGNAQANAMSVIVIR